MACGCGSRRSGVTLRAPGKTFLIEVTGPDGADLGTVNTPLEAKNLIRNAGGGTARQVEVDPDTLQPIEPTEE